MIDWMARDKKKKKKKKKRRKIRSIGYEILHPAFSGFIPEE